MSYVKPKKHLGQHFLTEQSIADRLASAIDKPDGEIRVLEIGPGTGILTRSLQKQNFEALQLIEIDPESVAYLYENHPELSKSIIEADFLKIDLNGLFGGKPFTLAGNFPYNISSQILFRIFEHQGLIPQMVGMFQKEVAERVASPAGSKVYGILSVLIQCYYTVTYLFTVDEDCFNPPPKVKSGVLKLVRNDRVELPFSDKFFKTVVKTAFNQRRKTLRNSLSSLTGGAVPEGMEAQYKLRPEQLDVDQFIAIASSVESMKEI